MLGEFECRLGDAIVVVIIATQLVGFGGGNASASVGGDNRNWG